MTTVTVLNTAHRFNALRSRLEKLGYVEPFSYDSVDLVLRLVNDLVQTTESCRQMKQSFESERQEKRFLEAKVGDIIYIYIYIYIGLFMLYCILYYLSFLSLYLFHIYSPISILYTVLFIISLNLFNIY
jgi:hypothetical protein